MPSDSFISAQRTAWSYVRERILGGVYPGGTRLRVHLETASQRARRHSSSTLEAA